MSYPLVTTRVPECRVLPAMRPDVWVYCSITIHYVILHPPRQGLSFITLADAGEADTYPMPCFLNSSSEVVWNAGIVYIAECKYNIRCHTKRSMRSREPVENVHY